MYTKILDCFLYFNLYACYLFAFSLLFIILYYSSGVIVAGHTRLKAAKLLGMSKVPVVVADDLTDEQAKAYRLADNKTAELAEWDFTALQDELDALGNIDMSVFGFVDEVAAFDDEVADKSESEYDDSDDESVTCPNCGLTFTP